MENIVLLTKRRSQIKQSITRMIEECCTYVDKINDKAIQLQYIDTLRTVTAGKVIQINSIYFISIKVFNTYD